MPALDLLSLSLPEKGRKNTTKKQSACKTTRTWPALGSKLLAIGLLPAFLHDGSRQKARAVGGINGRILLF